MGNTEPVQRLSSHGEREIGQNSHRLVGQFLGDLHQKMGAAVGRFKHREVEQFAAVLLLVGVDLRAHSL